MKIKIPSRASAPETELFVKIRKSSEGGWTRDVIFLLPGGPGGNHTLYADLEDDLFKFADLVIIDFRGCGYSKQSDVKFCTLNNHIDDIEEARKALKVDSPIILGCSYGAFTALGYAIRYPDKLSKLILLSGSASSEFIEKAKKNLTKVGTQQQIEAGKTLWAGCFKNPEELTSFYKVMAPLYMFHYNPDVPLPTLKYNIPYNTDLVNFAFTTFLRDFDFRQDLDKVEVQTLIISGKNDWMTDATCSLELSEEIQESKFILLDSCGHFPWKDQKEAVLEAFEQFFQTKTP